MLTPNYDHEIPEMTVEVAKAAFPKGNVVMKIRDELGFLFEDKIFYRCILKSDNLRSVQLDWQW